MAFFRKKKGTIKSHIKVADVYVVTSIIISDYNDGTGVGPRCVTMYFLASCEDGEYYELFSGIKLKKKEQPENDILFQNFNTPYIEEVAPLTKYLKNPNKVVIDIQSLFDFITYMNVLWTLGALSDEEKNEDSEEDDDAMLT